MSKSVKTVAISLLVLILGGAAALVIMLYMADEEDAQEAQSLANAIEYSYETSEMTTDLQDGTFVRIQFQILTDGKQAQKEITMREFQFKNMLIKELATMDKTDFKSGLSGLEDELRSKLNEVMSEGTVTDVYTISKLMQ